MKEKYLFFMFFFAILYSCSSDENTNFNESNIGAYHFDYMFHNTNALATSSDQLVYIQYDSNGRITKRTGNILVSAALLDIFDNQIYNDISYEKNQIKIELKTTSKEYQLSAYERTIFLDDQNKMVKRCIYSPGNIIQRDTIYYSYNSLNQISETKRSNTSSEIELAKYYYNSAKNLDSIVTNISSKSGTFYYSTIETFKEYDNAPNPLNKLIIFEDTYLRSLSKNNFARYQKRGRNLDGSFISNDEKSWKLKYDDEGNVKFDIYY